MHGCVYVVSICLGVCVCVNARIKILPLEMKASHNIDSNVFVYAMRYNDTYATHIHMEYMRIFFSLSFNHNKG